MESVSASSARKPTFLHQLPASRSATRARRCRGVDCGKSEGVYRLDFREVRRIFPLPSHPPHPPVPCLFPDLDSTPCPSRMCTRVSSLTLPRPLPPSSPAPSSSLMRILAPFLLRTRAAGGVPFRYLPPSLIPFRPSVPPLTPLRPLHTLLPPLLLFPLSLFPLSLICFDYKIIGLSCSCSRTRCSCSRTRTGATIRRYPEYTTMLLLSHDSDDICRRPSSSHRPVSGRRILADLSVKKQYHDVFCLHRILQSFVSRTRISNLRLHFKPRKIRRCAPPPLSSHPRPSDSMLYLGGLEHPNRSRSLS
ncbi:hypothetical protein DFH06DRAFT_243292 [Mycena polygramma]|nr:hypothetical protein DFH06DRAFT_243292 [Mycena polygramma]